jgi:transcriptional regulator with GAF, ATPase, and Fis domain
VLHTSLSRPHDVLDASPLKADRTPACGVDIASLASVGSKANGGKASTTERQARDLKPAVTIHYPSQSTIMTTPPDAPAGTLPLEDAPADGEFVRRFRLTVIEGPDAGKEYSSDGPKAVVGTHDSADFRVADEAVSRFHCELIASGPDVTIRDLQSKNGTTVSGVRISAAYLKDGALIQLGRSKIRFDARPDALKVALSREERFGGLVGRSAAMRRVFSVLERAAASDAAVLIHGETGTGKEIAAESVHRASRRAKGPFVVVDCGAIPGNLLEAELFGHEKGAFTGAVAAREGAFAAADGGTVFLDEIGELAPDLQPKLLRVLESKHIKAVGTSHFRDVDVRIVAATNRDLKEEVNQKRFRSDLYFRLAVVEARIPPLRERAEDIPLIAAHLLDRLQASADARRTLLSPSSLHELAHHAWSGNVRELRNYLERCLALDERVPLGVETVNQTNRLPDCDMPLKVARERWTRTLERAYVSEVLARHEGNVAAAARAAEVDRMHFYRLLWRYGLK